MCVCWGDDLVCIVLNMASEARVCRADGWHSLPSLETPCVVKAQQVQELVLIYFLWDSFLHIALPGFPYKDSYSWT